MLRPRWPTCGRTRRCKAGSTIWPTASNEGLLTAEEREEYAGYLHAIDVIAVLASQGPIPAPQATVMDNALRSLVRRRAGDVCEYCRLPQAASRFVRFHVEHIIARQHGGETESDNLALACGFCNFHKGPNIASLDPESGQLVPLFHPRRDRWADHFAWEGTTVVGRTAVGRATLQLLAMNDWQRVEVRENLQALGEPFAG